MSWDVSSCGLFKYVFHVTNKHQGSGVTDHFTLADELKSTASRPRRRALMAQWIDRWCGGCQMFVVGLISVVALSHFIKKYITTNRSTPSEVATKTFAKNDTTRLPIWNSCTLTIKFLPIAVGCDGHWASKCGEVGKTEFTQISLSRFGSLDRTVRCQMFASR